MRMIPERISTARLSNFNLHIRVDIEYGIIAFLGNSIYIPLYRQFPESITIYNCHDNQPVTKQPYTRVPVASEET